MTTFVLEFDSPVGPMRAYATGCALRAVLFEGADPARNGVSGDVVADCGLPVLRATARQLCEYFEGRRRTFDLPLDPVGTPFQQLAWRALRAIPYGETRSYADQARAIGRPSAVRAVGAANGRNPLSIVVPCHRVIGRDGRLTGFGGGLDRKQRLLDLEFGVTRSSGA